ncbi:MAG: long-chain fatty acid--CoA ligase [Anaerolineae bacterium]|nr:long-chain fatty acid--CoA ligase [Anaerolineae bacterium]
MVTYADKPWIAHYDASVPASLEPYPNITLHQMLRDSAAKYPDNIAIITSARLPLLGRVAEKITYRQLDAQTDAMAAALIDMGLKKGDRVALVMPNIAGFLIAYFGVLKAGGVVVATNPTYPADKMQIQINDCGARFVICMSLFYKLLNGIRKRTQVEKIIVTNVKDWLPAPAKILFGIAKEKKGGHYLESLSAGDLWMLDVLKQYAGKKPQSDVSTNDLAIFQYTGGTTGISKGAAATHRALVANMLHCRVCLSSGEDPSKEVFLGAIPMFHVYGMVTVVGFAVSVGATIVLVPNARDIPDLLDVINAYKPTLFMGVPALYNAVNNHPDVVSGKISLRSIRGCISGSAPLSPATKRDFERLSGGKLLEGFGLSEMPTASHCNPYRGENRAGSIGLPMPDVECRIVSLDDDEIEVPVGEIGELVMTGPHVMEYYHNRPEETAIAIRERNGKRWLYTGDIARMDEDGYFYIVDRKKDMALVGGFNVYPNNVEKVLSEHPAVLEVGVAAIPHPEKEGQEALKAWVVLKPDQTVTDKELEEFAARSLARYEIPTRYAFISSLPKTTVGKTLRRELVAMELEERERKKAAGKA